MSSLISNDEEKIKVIKFLMSIYPRGEFVSNILEDLVTKMKDEKGIEPDRTLVLQLIQSKLIYERDVNKTISLLEKQNPVTGKKDHFVEITEKGKKDIWDYMKLLYKDSPSEYIRWIFEWKEKNDDTTIKEYNIFLNNEIVNYIDVFSSLISPVPIEYIVHNIVIMRNLHIENEEDWKKIAKRTEEIIDFWITFNLVHRQSSKNDDDDKKYFYQLTSYGVEILNDLYERMGKKKNNFFVDKKIPDSIISVTLSSIICIIISMIVSLLPIVLLSCLPVMYFFIDNYIIKKVKWNEHEKDPEKTP